MPPMMTFKVTVEFTGPELSELTDAAEARRQRVSELVHDLAVKHANPPVKGEQVASILELWDLGWSKSEIAARLGISRETVTARMNRVVRGVAS